MDVKSAAVFDCGGVDSLRFNCLASVDNAIDDTETTVRTLGFALDTAITEFREEASFSNFLTSFTPPRVDKINRHYAVIQDLYEKTELLDNIRGVLITNFSGIAGCEATLRRVNALSKMLRARVDRAFQALSDISSSHAPQMFSGVSERLHKQIEGQLRGSESRISRNTLVKVAEGLPNTYTTTFVTYLCLHDLKDQTGFQHSRYYVTLTCLVDPYRRMFMYATTMPRLLLPGKFKCGKRFGNASEGLKAVHERFQSEGFPILLPRTEGDT